MLVGSRWRDSIGRIGIGIRISIGIGIGIGIGSAGKTALDVELELLFTSLEGILLDERGLQDLHWSAAARAEYLAS